jgi:tetratricopeptide (TPR) repeat protein
MQQAGTLDQLLSEIDTLFEQKQYPKVVATVYVAESEHIDSIDDAQLSALEVFKGFSQLGMDKLEDAMLSFENALNLNPESSPACVGLGEVFYLRQKDENAKLMYGWAVKLDPENIGARRGLDKVNAAIAAASGQTV